MHDLNRVQLEYPDCSNGGAGHTTRGRATARPALSEWQEAELAAEFLEVTSERELQEFLGKLMSGAARAVGSFIRSDTGRALADVLKGAAKQALPIVGRAIGTRLGGAAGGDIGAGVADGAGRLLGLELEGMSLEDREYEVARQFVKFANAAAADAASLQSRMPGPQAARAAVASAAHDFAPGLVRQGQAPSPHVGQSLIAGTAGGKADRMYQTEFEGAGYGPGETEAEWGRGWRRRRRFRRFRRPDDDDNEYGQAEGEYGEFEQPEYNQHEYGEGEYNEGEGAGGMAEYSEFGQGEYGSGEYGEGEYGESEYGETEYGEGEGEYGEGEYGESEERFLPFLPIIGKVLGGVLGGLGKEAESEYAGEYGGNEYGESEGEGEYGEGEGEGEYGEAEQQFLGKILGKVLGFELESGEATLPTRQEQEFAGRLMEVSSERELENFLGGLINTVGRAVKGVRNFANSPTGQSLIEAAKPIAKAALPWVGGAIGTAIAPGVGTGVGRALGTVASSLFEMELSEVNSEQAEFELARRFVRLTAAAAKDAATAPQGAPPELVGEFAHFRAARRFARPLFRRALRSVSPFARRYYGRRYGGFGRGRYFGRYYGGYRGPSRRGFGYRGPYRRYGYGYPVGLPAPADFPAPSAPEPAPEPAPPARPGYKWVAVPIDAPTPPPPAEPPSGGAPAGPPPNGAAGPGGGGGSGGPDAPAQSEFGYRESGGPSGQWIRRNGKIIVLGA